jgi:hypothetical protein
MPWVKQWPMNGSDILKMEELQWIWWVVWLNFSFKIWTSDCPDEKHPWKSLNDYPRSCRRGRHICWFMSHSFNSRFRNASGLSHICANSWLMISKIASKEQMTKMFWLMSLLVASRGFTVMMLKLNNNNPHSGKVLLRVAPRKHDRCSHEWKQCCLIFDHRGIEHYEFAPEG